MPSLHWDCSFEQDLSVRHCQMTAQGDAFSPERDVGETLLRNCTCQNFLKLPLKSLWQADQELVQFAVDGALDRTVEQLFFKEIPSGNRGILGQENKCKTALWESRKRLQ